MKWVKRVGAAAVLGCLSAFSVSALAGGIDHHGKLGKHGNRDHYRARQQQEFQLSPFYAIVANGAMDLYIHGGKRYSSVVLKNFQQLQKYGRETKQPKPLLWVDNGVLYIDNENWVQGEPMRIDVNVKELNGLFITGNVLVIGDHITSRGMAIDDGSDRNMFLNGAMTMNWLNMHGKGNARISWVTGRHVQMVGTGSGHVDLAGVVHDMRVRLYNKQSYDAQYLRVDNLMVFTRDNSLAKVFAINSLQNFAYDMSNILYYRTPRSLNRMTKGSGNVLQADWRP